MSYTNEQELTYIHVNDSSYIIMTLKRKQNVLNTNNCLENGMFSEPNNTVKRIKQAGIFLFASFCYLCSVIGLR